MGDVYVETLNAAGVAVVALAAPLIAMLVGRIVLVPLVVFEIALGMLLGPDGAGLLRETHVVGLVADLGLAMLFFMAGSEIDFPAIAGRPLVRAGIGWIVSVVGALGVGLLMSWSLEAAVFIAIALSSTALGTLIPVLRDARRLDTPFGRAVAAIGAVGEFGPLIAITVFLSGRNIGVSSLVLLAFVVVTALLVVLAARGRFGAVHRLLSRTMHTTAQLAVRLVLALVIGLVAISTLIDIDFLLGAFAAGVLWRLFTASASAADHRTIDGKVEAVGFGFLIPVFFIATGIEFDLAALVGDARALALVPVVAVALLVVRGLPSLLAAPVGASGGERRAIALFAGTALPIVVAVSAIGTAEGVLSSALAAALVGGAMLSVLLFPVLGLAQLPREHEVPKGVIPMQP